MEVVLHDPDPADRGGTAPARGPGRLRADHRGRPREPGAQARAVRAAVGDRARGGAGHQHLVDPGHGARQRGREPRAGGGHALLQPAGEDAPGRGDRRRSDRRRRAAGRRQLRRGHGQARDPRRRRPRLPGQPLRAPVRRRGAAAAHRARGHGRADRPHLPAGRRLSHGPVRADGPGGDRRGPRGGEVVHRAVLRRAALAAQPATAEDGRRRPPGPEERPRLVRVRRRPPPAQGPGALRRSAGVGRGARGSRGGGPALVGPAAALHAPRPVDHRLLPAARRPAGGAERSAERGSRGAVHLDGPRGRVAGARRARRRGGPDRLPAGQRGGLRHRRGRRLGRGRGRRA